MSEYVDGSELESSSLGSGDRVAPLRNAVAAIRRRWWVVVAIFLAVLLVTAWRVSRQTRLYQALAVIQIDQAQRPLSGLDPMGPMDYRIDPIQSAQELIKSQEIADRVASVLGLRLVIVRPAKVLRSTVLGETIPVVDSTVSYGEFTLRFGDDTYALTANGRTLSSARYGAPVRGGGVSLTVPSRPDIDATEVVMALMPLRAASAGVRGGIVARGRPQTNIVEIFYAGADPVAVQQIANHVAGAYRDFSIEHRQREAASRTQIILLSLNEQRRRLDSAQNAVQAFKERERLSNVSAEQSALIASIKRFEDDRDALLIERGVYEHLLGHLGPADTSTAELRRLAATPAIRNNDYVRVLNDRWYNLLLEREKLLNSRLTQRAGEVKDLDSLIVGTKEELRTASELYLRSVQSRLSALDARIASLRQQMKRYPPLETQEAKLLGDVRMIQSVYDELQSEYQRARIAQSVGATNVRIIDEAVRPWAPISPNRKRIYLTAIILGTILGLAAAVAVEQFDDSVKSPDQIREQFDVPVLGTIPEIKELGARSNGERADSRVVTHLDPRSPVAEAYRSLRTNLAFARAHEPLRTVVLTSPGPADGKSTTVANLAITFAQQGQRTLLVDADLRRAVLDELFDVPRSPGLTDVLVGRATLPAVVRQTAIENLSVVGSGPFPPNPSELLGSAAMRTVLREATETFDVVLLDSPPLLAVTDAAVLATMVDGAIVVVRMEKTPRSSVRRAINQLETVHGRLVGAVLNDVDYRHGAYSGYGYYYYYYYYGRDGRRNGSRRDVLARIRRWTRIGAASQRRP